MLSPQQESSLTSGGDCFEHWHSQDRVVTHQDWVTLINLEKTQTFVNGTYTIDRDTDYVLVDTTAGNASIILPPPTTLSKCTILKTSAANSVTITAPTGTINGAASLVLAAVYAFATLKAINGNYYKVG